MDNTLLGQLLLSKGVIKQQDLVKALDLQQAVGGRIGSLLLRSGAISEDSLLMALSEQLSLPQLIEDIPAPNVKQVIDWLKDNELSVDWCVDQQVIIWEAEGESYCATADPLSLTVRESLTCLFPETRFIYCLSASRHLDPLIESLNPINGAGGVEDSANHLRELAEEAPIIELVNNAMAQAIECGASDIHIEPEENQFHIRYRIDGVLHTKLTFPKDKFGAVVSRLKLISGIDIAERRLPQDGRLSTRVSGVETEIRVSTLPGVHGESAVMRLLPKERKEVDINYLGMLDDHLAMIKEWVVQPNGIILVTGPTGSGKSTTLYAALEQMNDGVKKIITVEDPVEYKVPGITQVQAHADIGLTFASALRSILRQDPDIIMIGEIRDLETAEIAVQSALTGHLVLSTLHTNDAISSFTRLIDMGLEPFLVANPIKAVQAQRLVRRLCSACREDYVPVGNEGNEIEDLVAKLLPDTPPNWKVPVGCKRCDNTGYKGRTGIYELVSVTEPLQELIVANAHAHEMKELARKQGFRTLREDGLLKAYLGETTIAEVLRVTRDLI